MILPVYAMIDLTSGSMSRFDISEELYRKFVGGKILGAKLLSDLTEAHIDPLSPEALLIVNTGPMNGTGAPSSSRFNMTFKNVLTGGIASSNCGGQFGVMLKKSGYDGLIIKGRAEAPCYIEITDGEISLCDASALWGLDTEKAQEALPKHYGKLVIGQAGENLVRFAAAVSGERVAGRCGAGAVMGSKNLKGLIAYGTKKPEIYDRQRFDKYVAKWVKFLKHHPMTGTSLPKYGSAGLVSKANANSALPTHNFKKGFDKNANAVTGEALADDRLTRNSSCISCPIRCERRVNVRGKEVKGPEYETLGLFGPDIDAADMDKILELNYECDLLGMDTISLAGTVAFAMELKEHGICDLGVTFGDVSDMVKVVNKIARREGVFSELANGSKWLSEKYGGKEYAMHAKGLEMASYEPRRSVGMGLGYATANRGGCHLNGGYLALLESVGVLTLDPLSPKAKPEFTAFLQNGLEAISACGFCLFTAQAFVPAIFYKLGPNHFLTRTVGKAMIHMGFAVRMLLNNLSLLCFNSMFIFPHAEAMSRATGIRMKTGGFIKLGERGFNVERLYNLREGLTGKDDALPERLTREPQDEHDPRTRVPLEVMLPRYYKTRGWDENGVPTEKRKRRLGL